MGQRIYFRIAIVGFILLIISVIFSASSMYFRFLGESADAYIYEEGSYKTKEGKETGYFVKYRWNDSNGNELRGFSDVDKDWKAENPQKVPIYYVKDNKVAGETASMLQENFSVIWFILIFWGLAIVILSWMMVIRTHEA